VGHGLIGTRSVEQGDARHVEIKVKNRERIISGIEAVKLLEALRKNPKDEAELKCALRQNARRTSASACC
jgi:cytochrome d ubiquinol oxidase subunit I